MFVALIIGYSMDHGKQDVALNMDRGSRGQFRWESRERVFAIKDLALPETAALVEQTDLVICPDSSMLHLAGALGKKIVTIFVPIPPMSRINHYYNTTAVRVDMPCHPCVAGESMVLTDSGYKQIQEISTEDKVLVNSGSLEKVTQVHKNNRENRKLLEIEVFGSYKPLIVTEDHKILTSKRSYSWKRKDREGDKRKGVAKFSEPRWVEAKDIREKDYCCIPIPKTVEPLPDIEA